MADCTELILSEDEADFIIEYGGNAADVTARYEADCIQVVSPRYVIVHTSVDKMENITSFAYNSIPKLYSLMDTTSMDSSGITRLHRQPYLSLRGSGILIGIVDTGIEYTHPAFRNEDGTTRIVSI